MNVSLYSYFDRKAHCYGSPFAAVNDEVAKRQFASLIQDAGARLAIYDTELFKIGMFNCDNGAIEPIPADFICDYFGASELLKGVEE